ncbi:MAG: hypothetical protein ACYDAM_06245 [Leptospirales bacterium]
MSYDAPEPRRWYSEHIPFPETLYGLPSLTAVQALWDLGKDASLDRLRCPEPDDLYLLDDFNGSAIFSGGTLGRNNGKRHRK